MRKPEPFRVLQTPRETVTNCPRSEVCGWTLPRLLDPRCWEEEPDIDAAVRGIPLEVLPSIQFDMWGPYPKFEVLKH